MCAICPGKNVVNDFAQTVEPIMQSLVDAQSKEYWLSKWHSMDKKIG